MTRRLRKRDIPVALPRGDVMVNVGKHARHITLGVFEMIGGAEAMAEWAQDNPTEFYTKIFPKIIGKEDNARHGSGPLEPRSIEEMTDDELRQKAMELIEDEDIEDAEVIED